MSNDTPSKNRESGEFRGLQKLSLKGQLAVGFAGVIAMLATGIVFVSERPTRNEIRTAIRQMSPSQVQFARLEGEVEALRLSMKTQADGTSLRMSRMEAMLLKRLDRIDAKLDEIYSFRDRIRAKRRRHR